MEILCSKSVELLNIYYTKSPYNIDLYGLKSIVSILYSVVNINTTHFKVLVLNYI